MGVADEWDEMEEYSQEMNNLQGQVESLASALAKLQTENKSSNAAGAGDQCHKTGCQRPIDWYCRYCKTFVCTRCSKKPCGDQAHHEVTDFEELYSTLKSKYSDWKSHNETSLDTLTKQKSKLQEELAVGIKKMAAASQDELLGEDMAKLVAEIPVKRKRLEEIGKKLDDSQTSFSSLSKINMETLSQTEFIKVFDELDLSRHVFEVIDLDKIKIGEGIDMKTKFGCYCIDRLPSGELLLGSNHGFHIADSEGSVLRSHNVDQGVFSTVQYYKGRIFTMLSTFKEKENKNKRYVVVFDAISLTEVNRWDLSDFAYQSMLAVSNDKVYAIDTPAKKIHIFCLDGTPSSQFTHVEFQNPVYMSTSPPDGVLVGDWKAGTVSKIDSTSDRIVWSFAVPGARGVYLDKHGDVWCWSSTDKIFYVRSSDGKKIRKIKHQKLVNAGAEFILSMLIVNGKFWCACSGKGFACMDISMK